jgi:hypothetical protein
MVEVYVLKTETENEKVLYKHNRSEMVAVLGPNEALPYYIHTYT